MTDGQFLKQMGSKIKAARKAQKLSLEKLSKLTGVDMSNLWFIEDGKRNAHVLTIKIIADKLGMDIKSLI